MKYLSSPQVCAGVLSAAVLASATAHAATDFTDADATDSLIETVGNWDNGLPGVGNDGTITVEARITTGFAYSNYGNVNHSADQLRVGSGFSNFTIGTGTDWLMSGTASINGIRGFIVQSGASFTLDLDDNTALADFSANNRDVSTSGVLTIDSGELRSGRSLTIASGGSFVMNGGSVTFSTTSNFGAQSQASSGTIAINAGNITADNFTFRRGVAATLGTIGVGLLDFEDWGTGNYTNTGTRAQDDGTDITFLAGSQITLDLSSNARALDLTNDSVDNPTTLPWGEALWNDGYLKYDNGGTIVSGADPDTLGWTIVSWADAINSAIGVGGGEYFEWAQAGSFGGTLSLSEVPEPSTFALMLGVVSLAVTTVRRRRKQ